METLTVERLLNNGFGMARREDGRVVLIPEGLPGEIFRVASLIQRKGVLWMDGGARVSESPDRCLPRCPHFAQCGGCQLLSIRQERELAHKCEMLRDAFLRVGKMSLEAFETLDFPPSASRFRGKLHARGNGVVGFTRPKSSAVVSIPQCHVIPGAMRDLLGPLETGAAKTRFDGSVFFVCDPETHDVILGLEGSRSRTARLASWARTQLRGSLAGVHELRSSCGRRAAGWGKRQIVVSWNGVSIGLGPRQFFQSNPKTWPAFFARVGRFLRDRSVHRIWDVHSGSGFLASCCGDRDCLATEPDWFGYRQLASMARERPRLTALNQTAESLCTRDDATVQRMDAMILDPPRVGLSHVLKRWMGRSGPPHVLYFSCDMATLCRDLADLSAQYVLIPPVTVIHANPGTLRLETVVELCRRD